MLPVALLTAVLNSSTSWQLSHAGLGLEQEQIALRVINFYRIQVGLPRARFDPNIMSAARNQAVFAARHRSGHKQDPSKEGFLGLGPTERMRAAGFRGIPRGECIGTGRSIEAIDGLMRVPYHRLPFMRPGWLLVGVGTGYNEEGKYTIFVANFGNGSERVISFYPADGQTDVPCVGDVFENPDPLRLHNPRPDEPIGYVITLSLYGEVLTRANATLRTSEGETVPFHFSDPANGAEGDCVVIIPKKPLKPYTNYFVQIQAHTAKGIEVSKKWSFTTGSSADKRSPYMREHDRIVQHKPGETKLRGEIVSISEDDTSIEMLISEREQFGKKPKLSTKKTKITVFTDKATLWRSTVDPLGIDMDRVYVSRGTPVVVVVNDSKPHNALRILIPTKIKHQ